ncbi:MAG: hypothetical protein KKB77_11090, partial [Bacteroidetes bacterium]|nr:hypothetical protein [Bacteroidota bacterium]
MKLKANPVAQLTRYELRHLVEHLEVSGREEDLHRLLALETSEQRNAWYDIKNIYMEIEGFFDDVRRARRLLVNEYGKSRLFNISPEIGLGVRYCLILTTMNSISRNVFPKLDEIFLERNMWSVNQALALALQIQILSHRVTSLVIISRFAKPHLKVQLLNRAFNLISSLPNIQNSVLGFIGQKADTLISIAPYLDPGPTPYINRALIMAKELPTSNGSRSPRSEALTALMPLLTKPQRNKVLYEALRLIEAIGEKGDSGGWKHRNKAMLSPYMDVVDQETVLEEAFSNLSQIQYLEENFLKGPRMISTIAQSLSGGGKLNFFLEKSSKLKKTSERIEQIAPIIPFLPSGLHKNIVKKQLLDDVKEIEWPARSKYITLLFPIMGEQLRMQYIEELLAHIQIIDDGASRAEALASLIKLPINYSLLNMDIIGKHISKIDENEQLKILVTLPRNIFGKVSRCSYSETLHKLGKAKDNLELLVAFYPNLPSEYLEEALQLVLDFSGDKRTEALLDIIKYLDFEQQIEVFEKVIDQIPPSDRYVEERIANKLIGLSPELLKMFISRLYKLIWENWSDINRAKFVSIIAPYLPEIMVEEILEIYKSKKAGFNQGYIFAALFPTLDSQKQYFVIREIKKIANVGAGSADPSGDNGRFFGFVSQQRCVKLKGVAFSSTLWEA